MQLHKNALYNLIDIEYTIFQNNISTYIFQYEFQEFYTLHALFYLTVVR